MTYGFLENGLKPFADYPENSPEIILARDYVHRKIQEEVESLILHLDELPVDYYTYWIKNTVAFALAMYQAGNYVEPS
jgi:hypothetical protein